MLSCFFEHSVFLLKMSKHASVSSLKVTLEARSHDNDSEIDECETDVYPTL